MKLRLLLPAFILFATTAAFAQNARFPTSGTIEYEKSVNMYALIKKSFSSESGSGMFGDILENYKKNNPQFKVLKSTLTFSGDKTFFAPSKEAEATGNFLFGMVQTEQPNTTYTDLNSRLFFTQKEALGETFLVKDTTRKINWKLTSEMRTIAGYECRRANAVIMDSVYVVAFYTDKIPVSGGPESFTGLPGMILGVALPHENITWFATKVTDREVNSTEMKPPTKGKPADLNALKEIITKSLKGGWGNRFQSSIKAYLL